MLMATPIRNTAARVELIDDGGLRLTVPRRRPAFLVPPISWFIHPRATRALLLDRLGAHVWALCQEDRTVEQVVDTFAETHQLTFHEARVAVGNYIRQLIERGAMAIAVPK